MISVIIAGGSGTRLWPLSTPSYPKHLLSIGSDSKSLLQNTYERAKTISDQVYVITESSHAHHVKDQLPNISNDCLVIEPARRGTASCIVASLVRIAETNNEEALVAFLHADHYVRDVEGFTQTFRIASKVSKAESRIVLVGVEPDGPSTAFGYIQKNGLLEKGGLVYNVDSFKEKPEFAIAQEYVKSGNYLWNCGYFVGSLATFKLAMDKHAPDMFKAYNELRTAAKVEKYEEIYLGLKNAAIDYALIEKVTDLLVLPAAFDWLDLGSYGDLHKAVESDKNGNHVKGPRIEIDGVENSFIQNYEDKPLAVIGLDNVAVINTPNGILVTRKDLAQKVGEVSKRISNLSTKISK